MTTPELLVAKKGHVLLIPEENTYGAGVYVKKLQRNLDSTLMLLKISDKTT